MNAAVPFQLRELERSCLARDHANALKQVFAMLEELELTDGDLRLAEPVFDGDETMRPAALLARAAGAVGSLFSDPDFALSRADFFRLIQRHHWLCALFAASPLGDADHVMRSMNARPEEQGIELLPDHLLKFLLMVTPESEIRIDVETLWQADATATASLLLSLLACRVCGTRAAHRKREILLEWLPPRMAEVRDRIAELPLGLFHRVAAFSSCAQTPGKHGIKRALNAMLRSLLEARGVRDVPAMPPLLDIRPTMFVVLDQFNLSQPVFRTHAETLRAARARFHLIGLGRAAAVDADGRAVFDEFVPLGVDSIEAVAAIRALALERRPQVVFLPCVGLTGYSSLVGNLRLAPLQIAAWGHAASTHASRIDLFAVEEDLVGDPQVYSEELLVLPRDAQRFVPRSSGAESLDSVPSPAVAPERIRVAVLASAARLGGGFLEACAEIRARAGRPVEFHFVVGDARGVIAIHLAKAVRRLMREDVAVHAALPQDQAQQLLRRCDLFLEPFPFGNVDAVMDAVSAGLVGVCMSGPEVHARIGAALFDRMGLPEWLVARSTAEYVEAALRLIGEDELRLDLRADLVRSRRLARLFTGRPECLAERIHALLQERAGAAAQAA